MGLLPIRKVAFNKVALTSYYAKIYVSRSEKQKHNYAGWLTNRIAALVMDSNSVLKNAMLSNVFDSTVKTPHVYSALSMRFRSFSLGERDFFFDYRAREAQFGKAEVAAAEHNQMVVVGRAVGGLMVMDLAGFMYVSRGGELEPIGTFESLLGIEDKAPLEMAEVKIFGKLIPLGVVLAYKLGFKALLELTRSSYRIIPTGERLYLNSNEFAIRFENETLAISRDNRLSALLLSGFTSFEGVTRNYSSHLFDRPDIYLNLLESANLGLRHLREVDMMAEMFIDPITHEILEDMREPTTFIGLLLRATELLLNDWSPAETDMTQMRIKGYERVPGLIYGELVKSLRLFRARGGNPNAKVDLHPYVVWQSLTQDASVKIVEDSSPINNVKEKEEVTYSGEGGRSDRSMVGRTRVFDPTDMGIISEATKDSAQVSVTTYLTGSPNLRNLRGVTNRYDMQNPNPTATWSSSALLAPGADRDDMKRVGFISIQNSSSTYAKGYRTMPFRTGYEQVIAHRCDDLFAATASGKGKVISKTAQALTIEYDNGETQAVQLGRRYGTVAAMTLPHLIVSTLEVGDTVGEGDVVAFNSHYFEADPLNPRSANMKFGCLLNVALMESSDTLEDSCALSTRAAELLESETTEVRDIVVKFDEEIHDIVQVGSAVGVDDILCTIEDPVTSHGKLFDDTSRDTLKLLAASNPKAKVKGIVEKIEVYYHGDIDDLSPSLLELAQESDRNRKRLSRQLKTNYTTGQVDGSMSVGESALARDSAVVRIYITSNRHMAAGDKGVFANQLKSVVGRIMLGENVTESGEPIDAIFGYLSVSNRIVRSPEIMGTTNILAELITKRAVEAYRKGK